MSTTSRYLLEDAPGGLVLVQDLVNTHGVPAYGVRDLLGTVGDAQRWVSDAVGRWKPYSRATGGPGRLTSGDLVGLRELREEVDRLLERRQPARSEASCLVVVGRDGRARLQPSGRGPHWLAAAVRAEVLLAQRDGSWERLRTCRNPVCPCAFHDGSRNNSRVWHDVSTCGNVANLRASRARRRADAT